MASVTGHEVLHCIAWPCIAGDKGKQVTSDVVAMV